MLNFRILLQFCDNHFCQYLFIMRRNLNDEHILNTSVELKLDMDNNGFKIWHKDNNCVCMWGKPGYISHNVHLVLILSTVIDWKATLTAAEFESRKILLARCPWRWRNWGWYWRIWGRRQASIYICVQGRYS